MAFLLFPQILGYILERIKTPSIKKIENTHILDMFNFFRAMHSCITNRASAVQFMGPARYRPPPCKVNFYLN